MAITVAMRTQVSQLYVALFGRAPDGEGLGYWVGQLDTGVTLQNLAQSMFSVAPARAYYPSFLTNGEIVTSFYTNVLGRTPDADGLNYWTAEMNKAGATPGKVIVDMITAVTGYAGTDAAALTSKNLFTNKVAVAQYYGEKNGNVADATGALNGVTAVAATVDAAKLAIDTKGQNATSQTFTLTTGADAPVGGSGNDLFVASEASLSSADVLTGGAGTDTLRYAASGSSSVTESGFAASSIERVSVTSDATGGTTFDVTGVTGLTTIINDNSSTNVTFDGLGAIAALEATGISAGNTTVAYKSTTVAGTADTQTILLNDNVTNDNKAIGTFTVNGVETIAVTSTGAPSKLTAVASDKLSAVTVAGSANVDLGTVNFQGATSSSATAAGNTLNASTYTGALSVKLGNNSASVDVAVTGGTGADRVDFGASYDKLDSFAGGDGVDTVAMTNAVAIGVASTDSGSVSAVEILAITTAGTGNVNMTNFAGVTQVNYEEGLTKDATATVNNTGATQTVAVYKVGTDSANLTMNLKADGAADVANVQLWDIGAADVFGTLTTATGTATTTAPILTASEYETVNLVVRDDTTVDGIGKLTVANIVTASSAQVATAMTVDTNAALVITAATTNAAISGNADGDLAGLKSFDASASTASVDASAIDYQVITSGADQLGATIKMGSGDDVVVAGNGIDTITLGAGKDTIYYTTVAQSDRDMDTITDFVSGTDTINIAANAAGTLTSWGGSNFTTAGQFAGNRANFAEAQGALKAGGTVNAVFQVDTNTLWVDANGDGTLDNRDFRVKLSGVTAVTTADLGIKALAGNSVTLEQATSSVTTTVVSPATKASPGNTTAYDDTVTTTAAFLSGSTLTGGAESASGADVLVITTAATGPLSINNGTTGGIVTGFETLTLGNFTNSVTFTAGSGIKNFNGGTAADTIVSTNMTAGGTISTGAGNDVVTNAQGVATTVSLGDGDDSLTTSGTLVAADTFTGGAGTDTLTLDAAANIAAGSVSGFEVLANAGNTISLTVAQYNAVATHTGAGVQTFTNTGDVTVTATSTAQNFALAAAGNKLTTSQVATTTVTGGAANDTVIFSAGWSTADSIDLAGGTSDTVEIAYDVGGAIDLGGTAATLANVEVFNLTAAQAAAFTLTLDAALLRVDASAAGAATTVVATNAAMTALTLGAGNDVITTVTANTAAQVIDLGAGNETITAFNTGAGTMTLKTGTGNLTVTDVAAVGAGVLTLQLDAPLAASTTSVNFAATTANLAVGTVFDFASNVTAIVNGAANGVNGSAVAGQLFVDTATTAGATILTFDANGDKVFGVGDVQITIVGNVVSGNIVSGNFVLATSA